MMHFLNVTWGSVQRAAAVLHAPALASAVDARHVAGGDPYASSNELIIYDQIPDRGRGRGFATGIHLNEAVEWSKRPGPPQATLRRS